MMSIPADRKRMYSRANDPIKRKQNPGSGYEIRSILGIKRSVLGGLIVADMNTAHIRVKGRI